MTIKEKHVIDIFKGFSLFFILFLIYYYNKQDNLTLWIYASLHGSYGIMWCIKSQSFPDKNWEKPLTLYRFILIVSGLLAYWISPIIISYYNIKHTNLYYFCCIILYNFGIFFHFTSDMQKTTLLKLKLNILINDGLWKYTRNPNYFGELLIYLSFILLSAHWLPTLCLLLIICLEWIPNMIKKEKSLSRYKEFNNYKKNSSFIIPKIF